MGKHNKNPAVTENDQRRQADLDITMDRQTRRQTDYWNRDNYGRHAAPVEKAE